MGKLTWRSKWNDPVGKDWENRQAISHWDPDSFSGSFPNDVIELKKVVQGGFWIDMADTTEAAINYVIRPTAASAATLLLGLQSEVARTNGDGVTDSQASLDCCLPACCLYCSEMLEQVICLAFARTDAPSCGGAKFITTRHTYTLCSWSSSVGA